MNHSSTRYRQSRGPENEPITYPSFPCIDDCYSTSSSAMPVTFASGAGNLRFSRGHYATAPPAQAETNYNESAGWFSHFKKVGRWWHTAAKTTDEISVENPNYHPHLAQQNHPAPPPQSEDQPPPAGPFRLTVRAAAPAQKPAAGRGDQPCREVVVEGEQSWIARALRRYANIENMPRMPAFLAKQSKKEPQIPANRSTSRILKVVTQTPASGPVRLHQQATLSITATPPIRRRILTQPPVSASGSVPHSGQEPLPKTGAVDVQIPAQTFPEPTSSTTTAATCSAIPIAPVFATSVATGIRATLGSTVVEEKAAAETLRKSHELQHSDEEKQRKEMTPVPTVEQRHGQMTVRMQMTGRQDAVPPPEVEVFDQNCPQPSKNVPIILVHEDPLPDQKSSSPDIITTSGENLLKIGYTRIQQPSPAVPPSQKQTVAAACDDETAAPQRTVLNVAEPEEQAERNFIQDEIWLLPLPRVGVSGWQVASAEALAKQKPLASNKATVLPPPPSSSPVAGDEEDTSGSTTAGLVQHQQSRPTTPISTSRTGVDTIADNKTSPPLAAETQKTSSPGAVAEAINVSTSIAPPTATTPPTFSSPAVAAGAAEIAKKPSAERSTNGSCGGESRRPHSPNIVVSSSSSSRRGEEIVKGIGGKSSRRREDDMAFSDRVTNPTKGMDNSKGHLFDDGVAEKVRACRSIVHELNASCESGDATNQSRAQRMFSRRKQRAARYTVCSPGPEVCPEDAAEIRNNGRDRFAGQPVFTQNGDEWAAQRTVRNPAAHIKRELARASTTNLAGAEKCQEISKSLKCQTSSGKGAEMFVRKQLEAKDWVVDEQRPSTPASQTSSITAPSIASEPCPGAWAGLPPIPVSFDSLRPFRRELERVYSPTPTREWAAHDRHEKLFTPIPFSSRVRAPSMERVSFSPSSRPYTPLVFDNQPPLPPPRSNSCIISDQIPQQYALRSAGPDNFPLALPPRSNLPTGYSRFMVSRTNSFNTLPRSWKSYSEAYQHRSSMENIRPIQ